MENNDSKPNTRSQKRKKTNKKTKIKKKNQNLGLILA